MSTNLPFFVYGTLRPTQGNYGRFLAGRTEREEKATFTGGAMYDAGGFPYVIADPASDKTVTGEVVWVRDEVYADTARGLDFLEGYRENSAHNHYDRRTVTVTLDSGEQVEALVYLVPERNADHIADRCNPIPGGDWINRRAVARNEGWIEEYYAVRG